MKYCVSKNDMMLLWKQTFGDVEEYISLVFNMYFCQENAQYKLRDGKLVSAMLSVPYRFCSMSLDADNKNISNSNIHNCERLYEDKCGINNCENSTNIDINNKYFRNIFIKGLYLCGLSTLPEYRGNGIMSDMIDEINYSASLKDFSFTFLVPANNGLRKYYADRQYVDVSYYTEEYYTDSHIFYNYDIDILNINMSLVVDSDCVYYNYIDTHHGVYNDSICIFDLCKYMIADALLMINQCIDIYGDYIIGDYRQYFINVVNYIDKYCKYDAKEHVDRLYIINTVILVLCSYEFYLSNTYCVNKCVIRHSLRDYIAVLEESNISGGKILMLLSNALENNKYVIKPVGLLFCSNIEESIATVKLLLADSEEFKSALLQKLKSFLPKDTKFTVRSTNASSAIYAPYRNVYDPVSCENIIPHEEVAVSSHAKKSFAMARITNLSEILKFVTELHPGTKFAILVEQDANVCNTGLFILKDAKVQHISLADWERLNATEKQRIVRDIDLYKLTLQEFARILWREPSKYSIVNEALSIPALPLHIALLLE